MRYLALATDYDGTIAADGIVDDATLDALRRARAAGLRLLLVTGREMDSLVGTFDAVDVFDRVIAENGALIFDPAAGTTRALAPPPPAGLLDALERNGVPFSVGRSIVATAEPYEHVVLDAIRELGLEWHVVFNKGSVMALPSGVTKATGLEPALNDLEIPADRTIGIGDAENDHAFLKMCGVSAAVANALPAIKAEADIVMARECGAGVVELIDRLLDDGLDAIRRMERALTVNTNSNGDRAGRGPSQHRR
jgi:hydroxymethylpyrimidine pyrophosphatase-like HAD family hydrolase